MRRRSKGIWRRGSTSPCPWVRTHHFILGWWRPRHGCRAVAWLLSMLLRCSARTTVCVSPRTSPPTASKKRWWAARLSSTVRTSRATWPSAGSRRPTTSSPSSLNSTQQRLMGWKVRMRAHACMLSMPVCMCVCACVCVQWGGRLVWAQLHPQTLSLEEHPSAGGKEGVQAGSTPSAQLEPRIQQDLAAGLPSCMRRRRWGSNPRTPCPLPAPCSSCSTLPAGSRCVRIITHPTSITLNLWWRSSHKTTKP